ncbi:MAG: T9SS type A sorting domain-containing protein [Marinilabiliaceae bacterium]|jgi:hypothetical protein|nr:T9SS type A sorting domain-containing protein [Marinilabiliaceae bacterium]
MKKHLYIVIFFSFGCGVLHSQGPVGSWEDHLPYHSIKKLAAGNNEIFGASDYAIAVFNKDFHELRKLSRVQGLTESEISTIEYSPLTNRLLVAYKSGNLDIYDGGRIINIPDILNKYVAGRKEINRIRMHGNFAYLMTSFGIVLLDIEEAEIYDTWNPSISGESTEVFDLAFFNDKVYAASSEGLLYADSDNPALTYFGNWDPVPGFSQGSKFSNIISLGDFIYLSNIPDTGERDSLIRYDGSSGYPLSQEFNMPVKSLESDGEKLLVSYDSRIDIYDNAGNIERTVNNYGWAEPSCNNAILSEGTIYIADNNAGIVIENSESNYTSMVIPGPYFNSSYNIYSKYGNIYVTGGLVDNSWNNTWTGFVSLVFNNRKWWSGTYNSWDAMRIRPFPNMPGKIAVSTWGTGLVIIEDQQVTEHFSYSNSPLETIIPGENYSRICGLAFDINNRLWITQTGVQNSIKVLKPDYSWLVLPYTINAPTIGDIIITGSNKKWIVLPRGHGLFVLDDNNTPENFGDDITRKITVKDQDGKLLNNIYCLTEDLDGNIWIGTDQGPAVFYNPDLVFSQDINCYRIKLPRNDGSGLADYLLGTETINTIAVDGGNRKWFGTNNSGVFLLEDDARELLASFNAENSPLLSNTITSISVESETGEVWIGTDLGIITFRGDATEGKGGFKKVYAYPNPVTPDFNGSVSITGLMRDTNVKISDISGNLVYETRSNGGQASWDLTSYNGARVASGVYIALCSSPDGAESTAVKILVIR